MTDKEKLIDLLCYIPGAEEIADFFLANGVTIPVRCKDCISYNRKGCAHGFGWCEAWDQGRMDDNYCNHGERRSDGQT